MFIYADDTATETAAKLDSLAEALRETRQKAVEPCTERDLNSLFGDPSKSVSMRTDGIVDNAGHAMFG